MQMYFCVIHFTQFIYLFVRELVMHNFVVRGLSFVGATAMFSVVCMAPCAEDIQPLTTAAIIFNPVYIPVNCLGKLIL